MAVLPRKFSSIQMNQASLNRLFGGNVVAVRGPIYRKNTARSLWTLWTERGLDGIDSMDST